MGSLIISANPPKMIPIRIFVQALICSLLFHNSVSACIPFTSTAPSFHLQHTDSSKIISFNSIINKKRVSLNWIVTGNQDIDQFEVERSTDGKKFQVVALIFGTEKSGMDNYYFFEKLKKSKTYYRVRTIAKDGSVNYSQIIIAGTI